MIIVQARIPVQSDRRDLAFRYIHDFLGSTRNEAGCIGCEAFVSLEDPDVIVIQQTWRAAGDLDLHAVGEGLDAFLDALPTFVDGEVVTLRYDTPAVDDEQAADLLPETDAVPDGVTLH